MNDFYEGEDRPVIDNERLDRRRSLLSSAVVVLVGGFLGILVIMDYCVPVDKAFSPMAFYEGKYQNEIANPRDIYNKMTIQKAATSSATECKTEPTYLALDDDSVYHPLGGNPDIAWPVKGAVSGSFDNVDAGSSFNVDAEGHVLESNAEDKGYTHWYIWAAADDMSIVSPWAQVKFVNANVDDDSYIIAIMAVGGGDNKDQRWLEIRNIENWFCHMNDSSHVSSHSTRIGSNPDPGAPDVLGDVGQGFAILGKATKKSYIVGMHKKDGQTEEECSPYYVFHPDEEIPY